MKIGDKVRVTFRSDQYPNQWFGDEGTITSKFEDTGNYQVTITKTVGTKRDQVQNWGEEELELILPEGSFEEAYQSKVKTWKRFFGI